MISTMKKMRIESSHIDVIYCIKWNVNKFDGYIKSRSVHLNQNAI